MTRRPVAAAAVAVVVLASGVGGWLLWMGRSPFGRVGHRRAGRPEWPRRRRRRPRRPAPPAERGCCGRWPATPPPRSASPSRGTARARSRAAVTATAPSASGTSPGPAGHAVHRPRRRQRHPGRRVHPDGTAAISAAGPRGRFAARLGHRHRRRTHPALGRHRPACSAPSPTTPPWRSPRKSPPRAAARASRCGASTKAAGSSTSTRRTTPRPSPSPPTARRVLTGGGDGTLTLWKASGEKIRSFVAHGPGMTVRAVAFARGGAPAGHSADGPGADRHQSCAGRGPLGSRDRRRVPHHPQRHALRARRRRPHPRGRRRRHVDPRSSTSSPPASWPGSTGTKAASRRWPSRPAGRASSRPAPIATVRVWALAAREPATHDRSQ